MKTFVKLIVILGVDLAGMVRNVQESFGMDEKTGEKSRTEQNSWFPLPSPTAWALLANRLLLSSTQKGWSLISGYI